MTLSGLQKFILKKILEDKKTIVQRQRFYLFYGGVTESPTKKIQSNIITRSLERLIDKGLIIGYGEITQHKLFISSARLTLKGKKIAKQLFGKQGSLPFKKTRLTR